jgi:hypothetical protein
MYVCLLTWLILSISCLTAPGAGFVLPANVTVSATTHRDPLTIVTGYFRVPGKRSDTIYLHNMLRTLHVNASYHFFYHDEDVREIATMARSNYSGKTVFTYLPMDTIQSMMFGEGEEFLKNKVIFQSLHHNPFSWPLILIWLSKFNFLRMSLEMNPFQSEWFMWLDVGLNALRYGEGVPQTAFPDPTKLAAMPRDKVVYSSVREWTASCMTGAFLLHASFVPVFGALFDKELLPTCFGRKNDICMEPRLPNSKRARHCRSGCMDDQAYMRWLMHVRPGYFSEVKCSHHYNTNLTAKLVQSDAHVDYCGHVTHCGWAGLLASLYTEPTSEIGMCIKNADFC